MKNYEEIKLLLKSKGQDHLLSGFGMFNQEMQKAFLNEISAIDWALLEEKPVERCGGIEPLSGLSLKEIKNHYQ